VIEYRKGNILECECEAITNTINVFGVMGAGLALQFKQRYPNMFKVYKAACNKKEVVVGKMWLWKTDDKLIVNFPTKNHWRNPSEVFYIKEGLVDLQCIIVEHNLKSLGLPALGCNLGKLRWDVVKSLIEEWYISLPNDFKLVVYEPQ